MYLRVLTSFSPEWEAGAFILVVLGIAELLHERKADDQTRDH